MSGAVLLSCTGGGIGDVLLATPVARALRGKYARIVALTHPAHIRVLAENPLFDEVWIDDGPLLASAARIRRGGFEAAVVTWATGRSALVPFLARIPIRVGQSRRLYSSLFTQRVQVRSEVGDHETHWTQILLDYARQLDCDTDDTVPSFAVTATDVDAARTLLANKQIVEPYALLHPTRGIAAQRARWPTTALAALAQRLGERFNVRVLVSGTGADREIARAVAQSDQAVSIAGETTLGTFAAVAQGARFTVAMDSGPMHLAAAVGSPTVGIFALQSDEPARWAPLGKRTAVVRPTYPCPPHHRKETCPDYACIAQLDIERIVATVAEMLT